MWPLLIATAELLAADVPMLRDELGRDWQELALSYPGYAACGGHERLAGPANRERDRWRPGARIAAPLPELRARLFFEQRREHFAGGWGEANPYVEALVESVRATVGAGSEGTEDPPGTAGLFPTPLGAEAARGAEWSEVRFGVARRFHVEAQLGDVLWLARRHGDPWLLSALGEDECFGALRFATTAELERFVVAGENLSPLGGD